MQQIYKKINRIKNARNFKKNIIIMDKITKSGQTLLKQLKMIEKWLKMARN